ncbi:MAG: hypothetical protein FWG40_10340 [Peptococcaceae bacterium]|nr:hypothetical protein [Peptococcaceae bacterium]
MMGLLDVFKDFLAIIRPGMNLLLLMVLPFVLHIYLSLRRNKWTGLIFPVLFFLAVVTTCLRILFIGGNPLWVAGAFCLLNAPTFMGMIVYVLCRNRVERRRVEELAQSEAEAVAEAAEAVGADAAEREEAVKAEAAEEVRVEADASEEEAVVKAETAEAVRVEVAEEEEEES